MSLAVASQSRASAANQWIAAAKGSPGPLQLSLGHSFVICFVHEKRINRPPYREEFTRLLDQAFLVLLERGSHFFHRESPRP
jgi:hypothetical protein